MDDIYDEAYRAYVRGGVSAVWEYVNTLPSYYTEIRYCDQCENDVPVLSGHNTCLVCGQITKQN